MKELAILLIEDSAGDAALLRAHLRRAGEHAIVVHLAKTLAAGMEALASRDFDAILLDQTLPDAWKEEGIHTLKAVSGCPPILMTTGNDQQTAIERALAAGATGHIVKGEFDGASLANAIRTAIEGSKIP